MPCLLIRHTVQDYSTWKAVFDEQADVRRANGSQGGWLFRSTESGEVLVLLEWDDLERARLFADSDDLREAMTRAGVTDRPDIWFLEDLESPPV
jgi:heme-degrading monooxygenase HmoA